MGRLAFDTAVVVAPASAVDRQHVSAARRTSSRHPSPTARAIRNTPAPLTTAPMTRATRSPDGARRSAVMAASSSTWTRTRGSSAPRWRRRATL